MTKLLALWSGDLVLDEVFWTWRVTMSLLVNIATSILFLVLIFRPAAGRCAGRLRTLGARQHRRDRRGLASGPRYAGSSLHADLARIVSVLVIAALTLT
jgi:hypothetical protein